MISSNRSRSKVKDDPAYGGIPKICKHLLTCYLMAGARAYYMHSILHDWADDDCLKILGNLVTVMKPSYSKLLIQEFVVPDQGAIWPMTSLDIQLMIALSAFQRTKAQFETLLNSVGLKITNIYKHPIGQDSVVEAELI